MLCAQILFWLFLHSGVHKVNKFRRRLLIKNISQSTLRGNALEHRLTTYEYVAEEYEMSKLTEEQDNILLNKIVNDPDHSLYYDLLLQKRNMVLGERGTRLLFLTLNPNALNMVY